MKKINYLLLALVIIILPLSGDFYNDIEELQNEKMPAKSKRRPRSEKNTVSLDI